MCVQGNYVHFGKGPMGNRTDQIHKVDELPLDGENTLRSMEWGKCAVVGNRWVPPPPVLRLSRPNPQLTPNPKSPPILITSAPTRAISNQL